MGKNSLRNKRCHCGSGKKYKQCHWLRESEARLPPEAVINKMAQAWPSKECMHPAASVATCTQVISAHTVGRSLALGHVVDRTKHVLSFVKPLMGKDGLPVPGRIGWKQASTITGFCTRHDAETFRAVEQDRFTGSPEQCFLLAYRAACYELFQKSGALKSAGVVRRFADRGRKTSEQARIQDFLDLIGEASAAGQRDMKLIKGVLDRALLDENWATIESLMIRVDGVIDVVTCGGASPRETLDGAQLQDLSDLGTQLQELYLNVVPDPIVGGGWYIFSWRSACSAPKKFVQSLRALPPDKLATTLVRLQFICYENSFFRPEWWAQLPAEDRSIVRRDTMITDGSVSCVSKADGSLARFHVTGLKCVPSLLTP